MEETVNSTCRGRMTVNTKGQTSIRAIERPEFVRYTTEDGAILQALLWIPEKKVKRR